MPTAMETDFSISATGPVSRRLSMRDRNGSVANVHFRTEVGKRSVATGQRRDDGPQGLGRATIPGLHRDRRIEQFEEQFGDNARAVHPFTQTTCFSV